MLDLDGTYQEDGDHIGQRGAVRLAKALWWLLARIAGWDGVSNIEPSFKTDDLIQLFPNPFTDKLFIQIAASYAGNYFTVTDIHGKELIKQQLSDNITQLDMDKLNKGIYFIHYTYENKIIIKKIIKL